MLVLKVAKNEIGRDCTILYKTDISSFSFNLAFSRLSKLKEAIRASFSFWGYKSRWVKALALVPA